MLRRLGMAGALLTLACPTPSDERDYSPVSPELAAAAQAEQERLAAPFHSIERALREEVIDAPKANLRAGPGTEHPIVGSVAEGIVVQILEERAGWEHIHGYDGSKGWVRGDLTVPRVSQTSSDDKLTSAAKEALRTIIRGKGFECGQVTRGWPLALEARGRAVRAYCDPGAIRYRVIVSTDGLRSVVQPE